MRLDDLPAGLPPGRLVTPDPRFSPEWSGGPVCWASQQPLPDAPQQWARLQAIQDHTGLRPILFWPGDAREPCHLEEIDALDAETILLREWHDLERLRQQGLYDPAYHQWVVAGIPEGVEVPPYDPGPPFASWPGLARQQPADGTRRWWPARSSGATSCPAGAPSPKRTSTWGWSRPRAAPTSLR